MSEDETIKPSPPRSLEAPMTSFVRGGTISSAYEQDLARKRADAEARRAHQDEERRVAQTDQRARLSTVADLGSHQNHAVVVLEFRNSDNKAEEFMVCELFAEQSSDPSELSLNMCCPFCAPVVGSAESQFKFSSKHRKFELDQRRAGELWVNPKDPTEFYTLAGAIHLTEAVTCPGLGCAWRFRIDNSVIHTLNRSNRR
jgi:hypothetical protein